MGESVPPATGTVRASEEGARTQAGISHQAELPSQAISLSLLSSLFSLSLSLSLCQLLNNGPSTLSLSTLELRCPRQVEGHRLVYPLEVSSEGPLNCSTKNIINPLRVKVRDTHTHTHTHTHMRTHTHTHTLTEMSQT